MTSEITTTTTGQREIHVRRESRSGDVTMTSSLHFGPLYLAPLNSQTPTSYRSPSSTMGLPRTIWPPLKGYALHRPIHSKPYCEKQSPNIPEIPLIPGLPPLVVLENQRVRALHPRWDYPSPMLNLFQLQLRGLWSRVKSLWDLLWHSDDKNTDRQTNKQTNKLERPQLQEAQ